MVDYPRWMPKWKQILMISRFKHWWRIAEMYEFTTTRSAARKKAHQEIERIQGLFELVGCPVVENHPLYKKVN